MSTASPEPPAQRPRGEAAVAAWFFRAGDALRRHLALESPGLTAALWVSVALSTALAWLPAPPLVDYPQHAGVAELIRRVTVGDAEAAHFFRTSWLSYNAAFHWLAGLGGVVFGTDLASRAVLVAAIAGMAAAMVVLLRELGRPPELALLLVPTLNSFAFVLGFVNHTIGITLCLLQLALVARATVRPSCRTAALLAGLSLFGAFAHVLATAITELLCVALALELGFRRARGGPPWRRLLGTVRHAVVATAPLLVGGLWCVRVFAAQYSAAAWSYTDPLDGTGPSLSERVFGFVYFVGNPTEDGTSTVLAAAAFGVAAALAVHAGVRRLSAKGAPATAAARQAPVFLPLLTAVVGYLWVPMVLVATHLVFPRFAHLVVLTSLLAIPVAASGLPRWGTRLAASVALLAGANVALHAAAIWPEARDVAAAIRSLPKRSRAAVVMYDQQPPGWRPGAWAHVAGYYGAWREGRWAYNFARYASIPVEFVPGREAAWPLVGWEFTPERYNPRCGYARTYSLVVVGAPRQAEPMAEGVVRLLVFGRDAATPRLIARHGRFWAFDTEGIPADGTP